MTQTIYEFGERRRARNRDRHPLHIAVANGFAPQTYAPLVEPLTARRRVFSLPPRPLWGDPPPPESIRSWTSLAGDLLAGLRAHDLSDVVAVGHSFGAVGSLLAVIKEPARFSGLVLLDPTIFPARIMRALARMRARGEGEQMPLVSGARARRERFDSVDEAYAYWRARSLFADWSDAAVRLYAESALVPAPDGQGLTLAWSPAWEAHYYKTIHTDIWRYIPRLRGLLPVLALRGAETNTFGEAAAARLRRLLPEMSCAEVPSHGHLFPQSAPDVTRALIETWLDRHNL
jgi:pimeloyl-ACP methyl ester carboxylesterase